MKTVKLSSLAMACAISAMFLWPSAGRCAEAARNSWQDPVPEGNAAAEVKAAQGELKKAAQEFTGTATSPAVNEPLPLAVPRIPSTNSTAPQQKKAASPAKKPEPPREPVISGTRVFSTQEPPLDAMQGSPETGYAGTWTDPATKDTITSVIAPAPQPSQTQAYPMFIEPQVNPGDWSGNWNSNNVSGSWGGWGAGPWGSGHGHSGSWGSQGNWDHRPSGNWPQWPGYPGDSGYLPPSPPSVPGAGMLPGRPFPPQHFNPGFAPSFPPPQHPGYRPLRPNLPYQPGGHPGRPQPGWNNPGPSVPPMNPGAVPGQGRNSPNFPDGRPPINPGMPTGPIPPAVQPGWNNPGINGGMPSAGSPSFRPLPMQPGGIGGGNWGRPGGNGGGPRPGGGW